MLNPIAFFIQQARIPTGAAILIGALAGWLGMNKATPEEAASTIAPLYLVLVVVLPLTLWFASYLTREFPGADAFYSDPRRSTLPLVVGGAITAIVGTLMFLVLSVLIPGSLGGKDLNAVRGAVWGSIPLWQIALVLVVSAAAGAGIARWAAGKK